MEGQELKTLGQECNCPTKLPWVGLVLRLHAAEVLADEVTEENKEYFQMRNKKAKEILNDVQGTEAKIFLPLILAKFPDINWEEIKDSELKSKAKEVFDIAAMIPTSLIPNN